MVVSRAAEGSAWCHPTTRRSGGQRRKELAICNEADRRCAEPGRAPSDAARLLTSWIATTLLRNMNRGKETRLGFLCLSCSERCAFTLVGSSPGARRHSGVAFHRYRVVARDARVAMIVILAPVKAAHVTQYAARGCAFGCSPPDRRVACTTRATEDGLRGCIWSFLIEPDHAAFIIRIRRDVFARSAELE